MQIDCEVTNTQLLQLQEYVIPKNLRNEQTTSTNPSSENHSVKMSNDLLNSTSSGVTLDLNEKNQRMFMKKLKG